MILLSLISLKCTDLYEPTDSPLVVTKKFKRDCVVCIKSPVSHGVILFNKWDHTKIYAYHDNITEGPFKYNDKVSGFDFGTSNMSVQVHLLEEAIISFGVYHFNEHIGKKIVMSSYKKSISNENAFYFNTIPADIQYTFDINQGSIEFIYNSSSSDLHQNSSKVTTLFTRPAILNLSGAYDLQVKAIDYRSDDETIAVIEDDTFKIFKRQTYHGELSTAEIAIIVCSAIVVIGIVVGVTVYMKIMKTHDPSLKDDLIDEDAV